MSCVACAQNRTYQKTSSDGLTCQCQAGYKYVENFNGKAVQCEKCAANQAVSADGWECVTCSQTVNTAGTCKDCGGTRNISIERGLDGQWLTAQTSVCRTCAEYTAPNAGKTQCSRCNHILKIRPNLRDCKCETANEFGGLCFKPADNVPTAASGMFYIPLENGGQKTSAFFQRNLQAADAMCRVYKNITACQTLANMCTLIYYDRGSSRTGTTQACTLFNDISSTTVDKPHLYYFDDGEDVIVRNDLPTSYTFSPAMNLDFKAAQYTLEGEFLGFSDVTGGLLQLCEDTQTRLDAAYRFGTTYSQTCQIQASRLWDKTKYPLRFIDLYLVYTSTANVQMLYKVPVNMINYRDLSGKQVNLESWTNWVMVRRFFLVDNIATIEPTGSGQSSLEASVVRYPKTFSFNIELQANTFDGKINIPYVKIEYADVTREEADQGTNVQVTFEVNYQMNQGKYYRDFQIACGTLGTLAVFYAGYKTWIWSKRAGRLAIDFACIINFFFYLCASLSNAFFLITYGIAFYYLIFFKRQNTVYLLHLTGGVLEDWKAIFGTGFALRCFALLHLTVSQCMVDIFLVDWERPRGILPTSQNQNNKKGSDEAPVSIWRTYFVANEWNEIQTIRKINPTFQIFAVVFFLEVVGFVNVVTMDPDGNVVKAADVYRSPESFMFRYALAITVYLCVGLVQWIFFLIYERFVEDPIRQFVDLCSMSNISAFIMANDLFGHYIHGRSVHGKADTDMREMHEMIKREEEDMCGQRGLMPNTDQQTFEMALPRRLRQKYNQVFVEVALSANRMEQGKGGSRVSGTNTDKSIEAYGKINRFLAAFVDHSVRDMDYVVKDKTMLESLLTTEFLDATVIDKGVFYNDNGHSFDQVLFYGHEFSLLLFDMLLFCVVDLVFANYMLAGIITYIATQLVIMIRDYGGRSNLAKKTLVDERFLI